MAKVTKIKKCQNALFTISKLMQEVYDDLETVEKQMDELKDLAGKKKAKPTVKKTLPKKTTKKSTTKKAKAKVTPKPKAKAKAKVTPKPKAKPRKVINEEKAQSAAA